MINRFQFLLLPLLLCKSTFGQNFINGSFENNTAIGDQINLPDIVFNNYMSDCNGFGTYGNLDIITSSNYGGGPQSGLWFVGMTGGGTDMMAMTLTSPLVAGNNYTISYYDKADSPFVALPIEFGLSTTNNSFGSLIYTSSPATNGIWTQRFFTFVAPNNGQYIVAMPQGSTQTWVNIDNFKFDTCTLNLWIGNDTTICNGATLTLSAGSGAISYLWSTGDTTSSISVNSNGTYWVTVTDICGTSADTIIISPSPILSYLPDTFVCKSATVTLTAPSGYNNYLWNTGANTQSLVVSQAGQYYVSMTTNNGCMVTDSATVTLNPNNVPDASFTATASNNMNGTFTTNFTYASNANNLQSYWDFGDGTSDTSFFPPPHIYPCGANYLVTHIISNECGADTFLFTVNAPCALAIEDAYQLNFSLYPNPISGKDFYVAIENREGREMPFYVYDVMGKLVFSETLKADKNSLTLPAHLANGVYIAKLIDSKNNRVGNMKLTILE